MWDGGGRARHVELAEGVLVSCELPFAEEAQGAHGEGEERRDGDCVGEEGGGSEDGAVAAEGGDHVSLRHKGTESIVVTALIVVFLAAVAAVEGRRSNGGVNGCGKQMMKLFSLSRLGQEEDVWIGRGDVPATCQHSLLPTCMSAISEYCTLTYFANSTRALVATGELSFFTSSMFRGGFGHRKESPSAGLVSVRVSLAQVCSHSCPADSKR